MNGILKKREESWLVRYNKCCIDGQSCNGAKAICQPEIVILPLHPDSWIWIEDYPNSKYIMQMMDDENEVEVEFEIIEAPVFGSSGLVDDMEIVKFAKLKTV